MRTYLLGACWNFKYVALGDATVQFSPTNMKNAFSLFLAVDTRKFIYGQGGGKGATVHFSPTRVQNAQF